VDLLLGDGFSGGVLRRKQVKHSICVCSIWPELLSVRSQISV